MMSTRNILLLTVALTAPGCQWRSLQKEPRIVDPVLPSAMSRNELVEYLNRQNEGLRCWQCKDTRVLVSMPGLPFPQKLSGTLSCSSPSQFRLMASSLVANADFGSNDDICWAYVKPGESTVLTWRHEDSHLLQHIPGGLPRLEPAWLMTILGVQPLNPDHYDLQNAPSGSRELWLVAVEDAPDGTSLRRVIKVDTVKGVAREHALYDSDGQALLRAQLSHHKSCRGHLIPHTVKLDFPQTETQLTLTFNGIEADCRISDAIWNPPQGRFVEHVDLGELVRSRMAHHPDVRPVSHVKQPISNPTLMARRNEFRSTELSSLKEGTSRTSPPEDFLAGDEATDGRWFGDETSSDEADPGNPDRIEFDRTAEFDNPQHFDVGSSASLDRPDFDIVAPAAEPRKRIRWPFWK